MKRENMVPNVDLLRTIMVQSLGIEFYPVMNITSTGRYDWNVPEVELDIELHVLGTDTWNQFKILLDNDPLLVCRNVHHSDTDEYQAFYVSTDLIEEAVLSELTNGHPEVEELVSATPNIVDGIKARNLTNYDEIWRTICAEAEAMTEKLMSLNIDTCELVTAAIDTAIDACENGFDDDDPNNGGDAFEQFLDGVEPRDGYADED